MGRRTKESDQSQDQTSPRAPALSSGNPVPLPLPLATSLTSALVPSTMAGGSCCKCGAGADTPDKLFRCSLCHRLPHSSERCDCSDPCRLEAKTHEEQVPSWLGDLAAMDSAACSKCGADDTPDQLLRCFRCHRLHHIYCSPEIVYNCCEACLLEAKSCQEQVPSWVWDLAAVDLTVPCRKDRFCPTCLVGFSGQLCPAAHRHVGSQGADAIKVHLLGEGNSSHAFVDVTQMDGLYDFSRIQQILPLIIAAANILCSYMLMPLHPVKCQISKCCGRIRMGGDTLYCSMECEVKWLPHKGSINYQFIKALLAEDFTMEHRRNAFCISCRVAFSTAVHSDHTDHLSIKIISDDGWLFACIPATEKWLGNFGFALGDGEDYRLLPLTPPLPPGGSCQCYMTGRYLWYCSVGCLAIEKNAPAVSFSREIHQYCTGKMERPKYINKFLSQDFFRKCDQNTYCFFCNSAFCSRCCPNHAAQHHPGQQGIRLAMVKQIKHCMAIYAEDVKGLHINWNHIQRIRDGGSIFIPLRRLTPPPGHRKPFDCSNCGDRMYTRDLYCCTKCRVQRVLTGDGLSLAKALVEKDILMNVLPDSFCTVCQQLFASACCSDHALHHAGQVIHIVHHHGSILSPVQDLLGFLDEALVCIQKVELNGTMMVPVCTGKEPLNVESGSFCNVCIKSISRGSTFCSLLCEAILSEANEALEELIQEKIY